MLEDFVISVEEARKYLKQDATTLSASLEQGKTPFGYSTKLKQNKYVISRALFYDFIGIPYKVTENGIIKKISAEAATSTDK